MNVASLENCKKLYELSGWDKSYWYYDAENSVTNHADAVMMHKTRNYPAYDLGYLLRKIPSKIYGNHSYRLQLLPLEQFWVAQYYDAAGGSHIQAGQQKFKDFFAHCEALSPEDAVAQLCIKLFEEAVL